ATVIGAYLFAMGVGSFLSRYVRRGVAARFVEVEIAVGLVGGWTTTVLFVAFAQTPHFRVALYGGGGLVGVLVGLEIPRLLRLLRGRLAFSELVAQVLSLDYAGALLASLLFPLLLVPRLGLIRTSLLVGLANVAVGLWSTWIFRRELATAGYLRGLAVAALVCLGGGARDREISGRAVGDAGGPRPRDDAPLQPQSGADRRQRRRPARSSRARRQRGRLRLAGPDARGVRRGHRRFSGSPQLLARQAL